MTLSQRQYKIVVLGDHTLDKSLFMGVINQQLQARGYKPNCEALSSPKCPPSLENSAFFPNDLSRRQSEETAPETNSLLEENSKFHHSDFELDHERFTFVQTPDFCRARNSDSLKPLLRDIASYIG